MKQLFVVVNIVIFLALSGSFYVLKCRAKEFDFIALEGGNVVMAVLSISSYLIVKKQMDNSPSAFVRGVYGASFLKLMVCMISILVYVLLNRSHIHKASVFLLFGIYAVYTTVETLLLSKLAKEDKK